MELRIDKKKALLTRIKLLRERGGVYSEIAEIFNDEGLKTPTGAKWETRNLYNFFHRNMKSAS